VYRGNVPAYRKHIHGASSGLVCRVHLVWGCARMVVLLMWANPATVNCNLPRRTRATGLLAAGACQIPRQLVLFMGSQALQLCS
jgi:EamA domain-containing membrane protein RarD